MKNLNIKTGIPLNSAIAQYVINESIEKQINQEREDWLKDEAKRHAFFNEKMHSLIYRIAYCIKLFHADPKDRTNIINLQTLQAELRILKNFDHQWTKDFGLDERHFSILLKDYK